MRDRALLARRSCGAALLFLLAGLAGPARARSTSHAASHAAPHGAAREGQAQHGLVSLYPHRMHGRRTASGHRFDPDSDMAAHRSLPFGTVARVTNLANGRSALVTIHDRGPYHRGRILDITPRTARALGMGRSGVTRVSLVPMRPPQHGH